MTVKQHHQAASNDYNFDHPDAFDFELLRKTLQRLKHFKSVEVQSTTSSRTAAKQNQYLHK